MVFATHPDRFQVGLWILLLVALLLPYGAFLKTLLAVWFSDPEASYGTLIPALAAYLLWARRDRLKQQKKTYWLVGFGIVLVSCVLQIVASVNGTILLSGLAFAATLIGMVGFLWGRQCSRIVLGPLMLLVIMVPLPSYAAGELSWHLQAGASTVSSGILRLLGVPVYQDGNLLALANYVLEVKQACSGSRSIFALLAVALVLGLNAERKWWIRVLLVVAAPVLAIGANVLRIVGTGLIARRWGNLAANESLHTVWGILVFVMAVVGLLAIERALQWATNEYA
jgi:exosortase